MKADQFRKADLIPSCGMVALVIDGYSILAAFLMVALAIVVGTIGAITAYSWRVGR